MKEGGTKFFHALVYYGQKRESVLTLKPYLAFVRTMVPKNPVIHIDDSDVIKPEGRKFEALGLVRDGSKSTNAKNIYEKGYHVTEACVLTGSKHPVSIFSKIHSSKEKNYTSANDVTFSAMERGAALFGKATFVINHIKRINPMTEGFINSSKKSTE